MAAKKKRALSSPSKLKNLEICSDFINDKNLPVHPVTERGTAIHKAIETGDYSQLAEDEKKLARVTEWYVESKINEAKEEGFLISKVFNELIVETSIENCWGYADKVVFMKDSEGTTKILLFDYKMGFNKVDDVEENIQFWAYALGLLERCSHESTTVEAHVIQPRIDWVDEHTFMMSDAPRLRQRIAMIDGRRGQGHLNPQPGVCDYCGIRGTCKVLFKKASRVAKEYVGDAFRMPRNFHSSEVENPEELAKLRRLGDLMASWSASVKYNTTQARVVKGIEIPGYELVHRSNDAKASLLTVGSVVREITQSQALSDEFMNNCATKMNISRKDFESAMSKTEGLANTDLGQKVVDALEDRDAFTGGKESAFLRKTKK